MKFFNSYIKHISFILFLFLASFNLAPAQNKAIVDQTKYDHQIKVACVGNSITYGYGIEHRDSLSYPAQLQGLLGENWTVQNFGVSARTLLSKGDHPYINEQAYIDAKTFDPDVVLIKLGTNDTKPHNWVFKNEFETDYRSLIESFQNLSSHPIVVLLKAVPAFPEMWGISDSTIRLELNPAIEKLSSTLALPLIDLYSPLENRGNLFPDKIHPNSEGAGIMAELIYNRLIGKE